MNIRSILKVTNSPPQFMENSSTDGNGLKHKLLKRNIKKQIQIKTK